MLTKSSISALLFCSILLIAGCAATDMLPTPLPSTLASGATETAYIVERGKVVKTEEFSGRISPITETPLHFRTSGYVKVVHVKQGEWVHTGDLLAELEVSDLMNQIAQAEVNLDSAKRLLSKAEESLEHEIALAELNLSVAEVKVRQAEDAYTHAIEQANSVLQLARENLARTQALRVALDVGIVDARVARARATDQVARAEIEHQEALERAWEKNETREEYARELQRAEWDLDIAQAQYDKAVADRQVYQHDLKIQELGVEQAEAELDRLESGVDPLVSLEAQRAQLILDQLRGGVDPVLVNGVSQATLTLEGLQRHLGDARVTALVDGQILSLALYPGRPVEAFRTVLVIADPSTLEVAANPTGDQLRAMAEGQPAVVVPGADPDRTWTGTVRCLPYPYGTCGSTEDLSGSDSSVRIRLENDLDDLALGALVQVTIVVEERASTLWLPPDSVRTFQGRTFVIVQEGVGQQRVDIETGIESQDRVEILKGLEEGQVIVAP